MIATLERTEGRVLSLDPARVKPFSDQPRKRFRGIAKLADSIRLVGQITPILVTPCDEPGYVAELVDGERRLRACLQAGVRVKAIYGEDAGQRFAKSVAANFCRQPHDCLEVMEAVLTLQKQGRSQADIAGIFGKTAGWVCQHASLARLAPEIQEALKTPDAANRRRGRPERRPVTLSTALLLVNLPHSKQVEALRAIQAKGAGMAEARNLVHRAAKKAGVRAGTVRSPAERFHAILSAVETACHTLDRYLDMPGPEVARVIRSGSRSERRELAGLMERLCENLLAFGDALEKPPPTNPR